MNTHPSTSSRGHRRLAALCLVSVVLAGCDSTERDWKGTTAANSRVAYEDFLKKHPGSVHEALAKERALELAWQEVLAANNMAAAEKFLQSHPKSRFESAANDLVAKLAWADALRANSVEGFEAFLKRYAAHALRDEARRQLMELRWRATTSAATPEAFQAFFAAEDADVDKVAEAARALGPQGTKALNERMKSAFEKAQAAAVSLPEVDAMAVRYGAFDFGLASIEEVERRWVELLGKEKVRNRFTVVDIVASAAPKSSFTMVSPTLFDQAKVTLSFKSEGDAMFGSGQHGAQGAVYVTELPKDRFNLSKKAVMSMLGFGVGGDKEPNKAEPLLQVYGAGSIWRYRGPVANVVGNIDSIHGTGPRGGRLTFLLVDGQGLVYVRGSGRVRYSDGREVMLSPLEPAGVVIAPASSPPPQSEIASSPSARK